MFIKTNYVGNLLTDEKKLITEFNEFTQIRDEYISILANASNHLKFYFQDKVNWVGFYLVNEQNNLDLGPFNGLPAVTKINYGSGVCGTCLKKQETIEIGDVCSFENHIACDIASRSEICIPVFKNKKMIALLDIDSPNLNQFSNYQELLQNYINNMEKYI